MQSLPMAFAASTGNRRLQDTEKCEAEVARLIQAIRWSESSFSVPLFQDRMQYDSFIFIRGKVFVFLAGKKDETGTEQLKRPSEVIHISVEVSPTCIVGLAFLGITLSQEGSKTGEGGRS